MKSKWTLFVGIILLIIGIAFRKVTSFEFQGMLLIIAGVLFKTYYIIEKVKTGTYKPGVELVYLFVGLTLFLGGIYLRSQNALINTSLMIYTGILLKLIFIIMFIVKVKNNKMRSS